MGKILRSKKPTGSSELDFFFKEIWDAIENKLPILDKDGQYTVERTGNGQRLNINFPPRTQAAAVTRHPFEVYAVPLEDSDPQDQPHTRWRIAPGWLEWRVRYPDADLQASFTGSGGVVSITECQQLFYFPGSDVTTDIVLLNDVITGVKILGLEVIENSSNPSNPSFEFTEVYRSWTMEAVPLGNNSANIPIAIIASGSLKTAQLVNSNLIGQNTNTPLNWMGSTYSSSFIYYPNELISYSPVNVIYRQSKFFDIKCSLGISPLDIGQDVWTEWSVHHL